MTQLTKIQILDKMKEFSKELGVLVDNAKRTKQWLDMAVCTEPGIPAMEKRLEEQTKLAQAKFAEFDKFKEENPFDEAPLNKAELSRRQGK